MMGFFKNYKAYVKRSRENQAKIGETNIHPVYEYTDNTWFGGFKSIFMELIGALIMVLGIFVIGGMLGLLLWGWVFGIEFLKKSIS